MTPPEIGLCSSKIFASNDGFMEYLANHVMDRDTFYSNTKKVIYQIMAKYIKRFTSYVSEYLETILVIRLVYRRVNVYRILRERIQG